MLEKKDKDLENNFSKEFLEKNKDFIKSQNEHFLKAIKEIENERKEKIENLIYSDVENDLEKKLPLISKKLQEFLFHFFEKIDIEDEKINNILESKTINQLLKPDFIQNNIIELKKFINISKNIGTYKIKEGEGIEKLDSIKIKNYKRYLSQKLRTPIKFFEIEMEKDENLTLKTLIELENKTESINKLIEIEKIKILEKKLKPFIESAISYLNRYDNKLINKEDFQSKYYNEISKIKSLFDIFTIYEKIGRDIKIYQKKGKNGEKAIHDCKKGLYQIQSIYGYMSLFLDIKSSINHLNSEKEMHSIVQQFAKMGANKDNYKTDFPEGGNNQDTNYTMDDITLKKDYFWENLGNGNYKISENRFEGSEKIELDGMDIKGNKLFLENKGKESKEIKVNLHHVSIRGNKGGDPIIDKLILKDLSSINEILDHKGIMFVIDNYKKDLGNLKTILENKLGTLQNSWVEELKPMKEVGNSNTSSEYNSYKGIIKIKYEGKDGETYSMLYEIQIFTLKDYIIAEKDKESEAYHDKYAHKKFIKSIPKHKPIEIYGKEEVKDELKKQLNK